MAHLVRIGNSQGIRIPKAFIEQAHLEGKERQQLPQPLKRYGWRF